MRNWNLYEKITGKNLEVVWAYLWGIEIEVPRAELQTIPEFEPTYEELKLS